MIGSKVWAPALVALTCVGGLALAWIDPVTPSIPAQAPRLPEISDEGRALLGGLEPGESIIEAAKREVLEETGIKLNPKNLRYPLRPTSNASYFYIDFPGGCNPNVQRYEGNDANAVAWISQKCLKENIKNKKIKLTFHTKRLLQWVLGWQ